MAKCETCHQEMTDGVGCTSTRIAFGPAGRRAGRVLDRIAYGDEADDWGAGEGRRCHDCYCPPGTQHHPGCDVERCPMCGHQLISCGCDQWVSYLA